MRTRPGRRLRSSSLAACIAVAAQSLAGPIALGEESKPLVMTLGPAWASNAVNAVVYRGDPITTYGDRQYAAYYNDDDKVVVAERKLGESEWKLTVTPFTGNVQDAHNSISIIADGRGYLHLSWDHHNHPLRYARSKAPGSLEFDGDLKMVGDKIEGQVTYPQFFKLPSGDLLFLFRDGSSGRGNLVVNRYDAAAQKWERLHDNLISGENRRNAYPQAAVDAKGALHVSWVWRDSPDVATNHDLSYARSDDGGRTWVKSTGEKYAIPITKATAEVMAPIPQKHELMNQTSMCADGRGRPIVATYFRPPGETVPQYFILYHDGKAWQRSQVSQRQTPFTLSGGGSKKVPISRPQVVAVTRAGKTAVSVIYRDLAEREGRVSVAHCPDLSAPAWSVRDLTTESVRQWEPSYDRVRWMRDGVLNLYLQVVGQGDAETTEDVGPQPAQVLEWTP